jgi:hypothetical protein
MLPRLAEGRSVDLNWDVLCMRATRSDSLMLDHVGTPCLCTSSTQLVRDRVPWCPLTDRDMLLL